MIEILKLEMVNKGSLIAKFTVKVQKWGGFLIKECTLFDANGKKWITLPSRQYEAEGKKKYFSYVGFEDRSMDDMFKERVLKAVEEQISKLVTVPETQPTEEPQYPF